MSKYGKLNLLLRNSIYLIFLSVEIQSRLVQTKLYYQIFSLCLKRNVSQTSKIATAKNLFPSVYVIGEGCFYECFLFHVIIWRHYFYTNLSLPRVFLQSPCCCVPWNKCLERCPYFMSVSTTINTKANTQSPN